MISSVSRPPVRVPNSVAGARLSHYGNYGGLQGVPGTRTNSFSGDGARPHSTQGRATVTFNVILRQTADKDELAKNVLPGVPLFHNLLDPPAIIRDHNTALHSVLSLPAVNYLLWKNVTNPKLQTCVQVASAFTLLGVPNMVDGDKKLFYQATPVINSGMTECKNFFGAYASMGSGMGEQHIQANDSLYFVLMRVPYRNGPDQSAGDLARRNKRPFSLFQDTDDQRLAYTAPTDTPREGANYRQLVCDFNGPTCWQFVPVVHRGGVPISPPTIRYYPTIKDKYGMINVERPTSLDEDRPGLGKICEQGRVVKLGTVGKMHVDTRIDSKTTREAFAMPRNPMSWMVALQNLQTFDLYLV